MDLHQTVNVTELAAELNAELIGSRDNFVGSINEIHKLKEDSLTFVDHPKYYAKVLGSVARVILIDKPQECPEGKTLLVVDDPFEAYDRLALKYRPVGVPNTGSPDVPDSTIIYPGSYVGNNVVIGERCRIYPNVTIMDNVTIGDGVIIHPNTVVGADAFYYNKKGEAYRKMHTIGEVRIEDNVEIGAGVTIQSGVSGVTIIGEGTKIDSQVHIGHGTVVGSHCLFAAQVAIAGKSKIGSGVILYGKVGVSKGVHIGDNAVLLASSNVDKDLKSGGVYFGSPAIPARDRWKEMACTRKLPAIWKNLERLQG